MKQVLQNLNSGETRVVEVPSPVARGGTLLIGTGCSLVSAGTERMLVEFGRASVIGKARQQPDKVKDVISKVRTDGLLPTLEAVRSKLDQPMPLGYCNAGTVLAVGDGVKAFDSGDRVVSNGPHAEVVVVPQNLCAKIPDNVSDEQACFTVLGAIALQGIRLLQPTLGERFVVTGLGLIGLMAIQILRANGCRVLGIDFDRERLAMAQKFGAETVDLGVGEDPIDAAFRFSRGRGVDGVLLTASTKSSEPVSQAAKMSRKRGRIVLTGVTGLELSRADFYEKELTFQVSCSYGPGRYDDEYEQKGNDYPIGYVRWTEQRNFEAILEMMADGLLDVAPLVTHRYPIDETETAYRTLNESPTALGIVIQYPARGERVASARTLDVGGSRAEVDGAPGVAFVGAGNYAGRVLIPAFKKAGAIFTTLVSSGGVTASHLGRKHQFRNVSSNASAVLNDAASSAVVIATRHDSHAELACRSLRAGKHVFVEKPLGLTHAQLDEIERAYGEAQAANDAGGILLMVGFNRRFAPQIVRMKTLLSAVGQPKSFIMTVNAGAIPPDHWTQDEEEGGGRIIGEACHFVDLLRFLAGAPIEGFDATFIGDVPGVGVRSDKSTFTLRFADGSFGTVHYLANGDKSFPKERLEVFCAGRVLQLDNYRKLTGYGWPRFRKMNLWSQDKGQFACASAFLESLRKGSESPIPFSELIEVSRATIDIAGSM